MNRRLLRIYVNDHLAVMAAVADVAARSAGSNRGSPLGERLSELHLELRREQETLERAMKLLRIRQARWKIAGAVLAQRAGRLKLNGRLRTYSPLSRVIELECLLAGVEWNRIVFTSLRHLGDERLRELDLDGLIRRSGEQAAALERFRLEAVSTALNAS